MLGSATIGGEVGLYEPVHGSAPDIADAALPILLARLRQRRCYYATAPDWIVSR